MLTHGWCQALVVLVAFLAGRWSGDMGPAWWQVPLADVAPEVATHLYSPPPRHGDVMVPSVVSDGRGEVHNLKFGSFRVNILVSRAGTLRSGDVHRARQLDMIFSGRVVITTREHGRDVEREYVGGQLCVIPENVPHIFRFVNDTVMAEWWQPQGFEARYYAPYRRKVDAALVRAQKQQQHRVGRRILIERPVA